MVVICGFMDQNTWSTIPVSEQKITLNNQVIEHWMIKQKQIKQSRTESNEREINNTDKQQQINWQRIWLTDALNINKSVGWTVTVLYLRGLNILWLLNYNCNPICPGVCYEASDVIFRFLCFSSGLTCGLLKNHRTPQLLCCFIPTAQVQYQSSSIITMIVSWE